VWFEGTAHLADALLFRNSPGDAARAAAYLADVAHAQAHGPKTDGLGIIAASTNRLSDCDGGYYYASLHTGATAWYILAAAKTDPFFRIPPRSGHASRPPATGSVRTRRRACRFCLFIGCAQAAL
jgi:hypothetical protein